MSWEPGRVLAIFWTYDPAITPSVISRGLRSRPWPRYVLEYIVYHEMLHLKILSTAWEPTRRPQNIQDEEKLFSAVAGKQAYSQASLSFDFTTEFGPTVQRSLAQVNLCDNPPKNTRRERKNELQH